MLRVVFIFLAIVAITLAFVLGQALLYLVAVGLIAWAVYLTTRKLKKEHNDIPESFMKAPVPPEVDLGALGIIDIRPKLPGADASAKRRQRAPLTLSSDEASKEPDLFGGHFTPTDESDLSAFAESDGDAEMIHEGDSSGPVEDAPSFSLSLDPSLSLDSSSSLDPSLSLDSSSSLDPAPSLNPTPSPDPTPSSEPRFEATPAVSHVRTRDSRPKILVSGASSGHRSDVLIPALTSLRASLDAHTVCLLSQTEKPLKYHIEAIVSLNSYARGQGSFVAGEPLLAGHGSDVAAVFPSLGEEGYPRQTLGYYHEPIAVRQVAIVPVLNRSAEDDYLLVADTMHSGGLEPARARLMLEQYARLVGTVLESEHEQGLAGSPDARKSRPRREIISEEIERARRHSHPLALALVYLNSGERMADADTEQISIVETEFELRLRAVANDGIVEHFGELTYGVFYHGHPDSVAEWAGHIQSSFANENGLLEGGVSVGVASLEKRHEGPDDFRADATAALKQAFDCGDCTLVQ